ncbi:MAG: phosphoketolase family protein [Candidatus Saccharimonadales bacterium]
MQTIDAPLSQDMLHKIDAYWRASNYLSVGQIYLRDNPLLKRPLQVADVKSMLLGHWGTTPGQNFIYVHLNRIIKEHDLNMIYLSGPGHGGPALMGNTYLEGTWSEIYPDMPQNEAGMKRLFQLFSWPGGLSSHVSPQVPGSIHEGGELGYSLSHAFGAVFDNPDLIATCVVGDGEAETGPLATAWHGNKFLNPKTDGVVLPILHLNGYKISNPTLLARIEREELEQLFRGYGWTPYFVEGDKPHDMHQQMAAKLDEVVAEIKRIQTNAREAGDGTRPRWPMIIFISPKGWTGPKMIDGKHVEGNFRSHQVPFLVDEDHKENLPLLEKWLKSYKPDELFEEDGRLKPELAELAPTGGQRMGANVHANGGALLRELHLPEFRDYAVDVKYPSIVNAGNVHALGPWLRDVMKMNAERRNFRMFAPDETVSNRLEAIFEVTNRQWNGRTKPTDEFLATDGMVIDSQLSEHQTEGWLEGYLLTGRHGILNSYEAFIRIVDSMAGQHAKWIKMCNELPWRKPISSLNYLLTSHVWRQDHNGFTHQDPGFIDFIVNKKAAVSRVYLPPDANTLLSVMDHCLRSRNYINLTICGKHEAPQWLTMEQAVEHCTKGVSVWDWASNTLEDESPDVVMAAAGDIPTLETMAAVSILREHLPDLKVRVVNVVDLMRLQPDVEHPHGLSDIEYNAIFTPDKEIIFAFHGHPWLIHRLTYRRGNKRLHVRGYKEEGTITTAFDMTVKNEMDRFHLVIDAIIRTPIDTPEARALKTLMQQKLVEHTNYIQENGIDMPEVRNWEWPHAAKKTSHTK